MCNAMCQRNTGCAPHPLVGNHTVRWDAKASGSTRRSQHASFDPVAASDWSLAQHAVRDCTTCGRIRAGGTVLVWNR